MFCPKCGDGKLNKFQAAHECEKCKRRWFIINTFEPRPVTAVVIEDDLEITNWINEGGR